MGKFKTIIVAVLAAITAVAGITNILQWAKIKPEDVRPMIVHMGWPHWFWLACGLLLLAISLGISLYSIYVNFSLVSSLKNRIGTLEAHLAEAKTQHAPPKPPLPTEGPKIRALRYGRKANGYFGLFVSNIGEAAFDVSIPSVKIGAAELEFWNEFPGLDKSDGEVLFAAHLTLPNGSGADGGSLRDELIRANLEAVTIDIRYRDFGKQWYVTRCELARDVYHGIRAGTLGRELAAPPLPQPKPIANIDERPDKATSQDWNELEARFEKISNHISAHLQTDIQSGRTTRQEWSLSGVPDTRTCLALCKYAGALLLKSPTVIATVRPETRDISNKAHLWLMFLKENHNAAESKDQSLTNADGYSIRSEIINGVAEKSMRACIECAVLER